VTAGGNARDPKCPRCRLNDFGRKPRKDGIQHLPTDPEPSMRQLQAWVMDSVCEATDGCQVEPDGHCLDGHPSWLIVFRLV
jgi:hypothetical protein